MTTPYPNHKQEPLSTNQSAELPSESVRGPGQAEPVLPDDLQSLAEQLAALGKAHRDQGKALADRITRATAPIFAQPSSPQLHIHRRARTWQRWLVFATPLAAAAAITLVIFNLPQTAPTTTPTIAPSNPGSGTGLGAGGAVQAANLYAQIDAQVDAWADLDALWTTDQFEDDLTSLTLDAAELGSEDTFSVDDFMLPTSAFSGTDS